jgi:hypothetical protein
MYNFFHLILIRQGEKERVYIYHSQDSSEAVLEKLFDSHIELPYSVCFSLMI